MPYNSIVVVREAWDTRDLLPNVVTETGQLNDGVLSRRFEPEDLNALEMALQIRDDHGGTVTAISLGASHDVDVLRESLFRGVDNVVRVLPPDGAALDTAAQADRKSVV